MAYAAVISLMNTIQRLLNSCCVSFVSPSREMLEFAYEEVESLQKVVEISDDRTNGSERMKALEGQMREAVFKLEDVIESHVSDQFLSHPESRRDEGCSLVLFQLDMQELRQYIDCFTQRSKKMKEEYLKELDNPPLPQEEEDDEEEEDNAVSSSMDIGGNKSEMVVLTDFLHYLINRVVNCHKIPALSIIGMAGIGKTALAKKIFEDPLILTNFESRAFVRMSPKYQLNEILQAILAQVSPECGKMLMEGDEKLYKCLCKCLEGRKYLIVLDDVWNAEFWSDFRRRFPMEGNGSVILLTTRLQKVADSIDCVVYHMPFLNIEESWDLLRGKMFGEQVCPPQLERAGKKIALNCEGLPLLIVTVADLLSKAEKTPEHWNEVAANTENSIFIDAFDQITKVLYPSYNYLPQYLKACFLYMGSFPRSYKVRRSRLINLWSAEGFLEPNPFHSFENFAMECMKELVSSNLVLACQWNYYNDRVKAWYLHSVFWHLCRKEARDKKFLHTLKIYSDSFTEGIESQRRLSIYNNILFGIKDVYNSMAFISTARSLLCTGAYHQYQVPICFELRLLRVLDVLTIRFYDFPMEVLKLVQLRYLALTYNGNIPPSISKLWNLQYLIIYQHLSIKSTTTHSYLPEEIWDLQELKYLHIMGRNLPDPCGRVLPNLLTLLDVSAHSCTKGVLESMPNLKKLIVQIELAPDSAELLSCFDHVPHLYELESLQFFIVNPEFIVPPTPLSVSSSRLKKLTLSGLGYPWEDMHQIAKLPSLEVLKLKRYAFRGEKWEVDIGEFLKLKHLLIEDADLVDWTVEDIYFAQIMDPRRDRFYDDEFPTLYTLTIKNCYKLQQIPDIPSLLEIRLVDCNPLAVVCAKRMETDSCRVYANSSWDDVNLMS